MNTNYRNTATQHDVRQQGYTQRPATAPAGYTTYEGGDFRPSRSAHSAYDARPARESHEARAPRPERVEIVEHASRNARLDRTARAAQPVEDRDFRIPRGERAVQAPAEPREVHPRQERASRNGGSGSRGGRNQRGGQGNGGKRGKGKLLIAVLLIALLVAGFGIWKFANLTPAEATGGAFYDQSASEIQEAIDHEVKDGYFNMSINTSVPVFEDNSAALGIRNIESNQYDCMVTVTLDDGREVYKSGGLAPGTELDMVTLTQQLEPGDYEATAVFDIYEQDEGHTVAGQTASKLTLHVL